MTAVDTNVLIGLLSGTKAEAGGAQQALAEAAAEGPLVLCPAVYAELMAMPGLSEEEHDVNPFGTERPLRFVAECTYAQDTALPVLARGT